VPAGGVVAGIAVSALILSSRDNKEQQQHHCNNTATAKRTGMIPHIVNLSEDKHHKATSAAVV